MVPLARRLLLREKGRLFVTIGGVGAMVCLLLFLFGVHEGVKDGVTRYVHTADADLWICQKNANNLLKSSSYLPASIVDDVASIDGVAVAAPLSRQFTRATVGGRTTSTLFLFGFDPSRKLGAPRTLTDGTTELRPHEIVLDRTFAAEYRLALGSTVDLQGVPFRVTGLSDGTNTLLSQYAFVRGDDAEALLGIRGIISYCLVKVARGAGAGAVARRIRARLPNVAVFPRDEFEQNNLDQMDGVLPVFSAIGAIGALVGGLIVALMLYGSVLERREDYAMLKAIGASDRYLAGLVIRQALLASALGFVGGALLAGVSTPLLKRLVPELSLRYTWQAALAVLVGAVVVGALAAVIPLRVLRRVYPAEVFRA
jgi:putative ABC transport system permease protein